HLPASDVAHAPSPAPSPRTSSARSASIRPPGRPRMCSHSLQWTNEHALAACIGPFFGWAAFSGAQTAPEGARSGLHWTVGDPGCTRTIGLAFAPVIER